jgi:hypothetical protein
MKLKLIAEKQETVARQMDIDESREEVLSLKVAEVVTDTNLTIAETIQVVVNYATTFQEQIFVTYLATKMMDSFEWDDMEFRTK